MTTLGKSRFLQLSCRNELERIGRNAGRSPVNAGRFLVSLNTHPTDARFLRLEKNPRNPQQIDFSYNQFRNTLQRDSRIRIGGFVYATAGAWKKQKWGRRCA